MMPITIEFIVKNGDKSFKDLIVPHSLPQKSCSNIYLRVEVVRTCPPI